MQIANCLVAVGGDQGNTVPKYGITATEIAVLRAIHGEDAVKDVEPVGEIQRSNREEISIVKTRYANAKDSENNSIVEQLFPGVAARAFETLAELDLPEDFMKATSRASVTQAAPEPAAAPEDEVRPLADLTVKELKEFAEKRGIDLGEATKKADILDVIVTAVSAAAEPEPADEGEDDGVEDLVDKSEGLFE